jgi:hypothetical protein
MGLFTVKDFELYANTNKIPLLVDLHKEDFYADIYYFKKDQDKIREDFFYMVPATLFLNRYVIEDNSIEYSQQSLLECKDLLYKEK